MNIFGSVVRVGFGAVQTVTYLSGVSFPQPEGLSSPACPSVGNASSAAAEVGSSRVASTSEGDMGM